MGMFSGPCRGVSDGLNDPNPPRREEPPPQSSTDSQVSSFFAPRRSHVPPCIFYGYACGDRPGLDSNPEGSGIGTTAGTGTGGSGGAGGTGGNGGSGGTGTGGSLDGLTSGAFNSIGNDCMTALGCNSFQQLAQQLTTNVYQQAYFWSLATAIGASGATIVGPAVLGSEFMLASSASTIVSLGGAFALNSGAYGQMIGWGTGQTPAATTQTISVNIHLTAQQVQLWANQGLPNAWVRTQLNSYTQALAQGGAQLNNYQLVPRFALMQRILSLWPNQ